MKAEKAGLQAWVFLLSQKWNNLSSEEIERRLKTWGLVFICSTCQKNYRKTVRKHLLFLQECARKKDPEAWFLFVRHEINPNASKVYQKYVSKHSYHYLAAVCYMYEPKVNPAYCKRVQRFLKDWKPQVFDQPNQTWDDFETLWDQLDAIYPRQKYRRQALYEYFSQ